jgi:hypothetical protein
MGSDALVPLAIMRKQKAACTSPIAANALWKISSVAVYSKLGRNNEQMIATEPTDSP